MSGSKRLGTRAKANAWRAAMLTFACALALEAQSADSTARYGWAKRGAAQGTARTRKLPAERATTPERYGPAVTAGVRRLPIT
jgi:hypothetical protein